MIHFIEIPKQECCSRKTVEEKGGHREVNKLREYLDKILKTA